VDKRPTSLERILGRAIHSSEVRPRLIARFGEVFGCAMIPVAPVKSKQHRRAARHPQAALLEAGIAKGSEA